MNARLQDLSVFFAAGALGGCAETLTVWIAGVAGIPRALGVDMAPALSSAWIYSAVAWGGLWGALFFIPFQSRRYLLRGLLFSLAPTAVQLLVVFPLLSNQGPLGTHLGALTPLLVLIYDAVWGVTASAWLRHIHDR